MGLTHANITLKNSGDVSLSRRKMIGADEIRSIEINCLVDTGAMTIVINEEIREALGLDIIGERLSQMADGRKRTLPLAGPIDIWFGDRLSTTNAIVMPDDNDPLLGVTRWKKWICGFIRLPTNSRRFIPEKGPS